MNLKSQQLTSQITQHIQELAKATDAARLSEGMQRYLETCARFHQYSYNNLWLILMARPDATQVAGFCKWKEMGRYVCKGEKGIPILAPIIRKIENEDRTEKYHIVGFKVVYLFDISQTEGEPLPEPPEWKSPEKHQELLERLFRYVDQKGIQITLRELPGDVQGVSRGGAIEIDSNAGTKTVIHEIAHELMHQGSNRHLTTPAIRELEAESVAYVVARYFGVGNLNSPNYAALWGADAEAILNHMERIRETASAIINGLEGEAS